MVDLSAVTSLAVVGEERAEGDALGVTGAESMPLGVVHLTVKEAAERAGVTEHALRLYIRQGAVPARKSGSRWLVPEPAVPGIQRLATGKPERKAKEGRATRADDLAALREQVAALTTLVIEHHDEVDEVLTALGGAVASLATTLGDIRQHLINERAAAAEGRAAMSARVEEIYTLGTINDARADLLHADAAAAREHAAAVREWASRPWYWRGSSQ